MAQGLSTPNPSLSPTHLSIRRGRTTTTHYTHHQVSLMVSRNTTLVPSLGLRIGPACEAGLSAGMRRERVPPRIRKKRKKEDCLQFQLVRLKGPISQLLWPEDVFIPHSISTHHHIVSCDFRSFPLSLGTKCLFKTFHLQNVYALILSAITHLWPYYRQVCLVEPTKLLYMLKHSTVFSPLKVNDTRISTHLSQTKQFYVYYIHLHILQFIKLLTSD